MSTVAPHRIAGAPISWGVCEVPGWGYQPAADRVLAEMRLCGLTATELGPDGFLPHRPADAAEVLAAYGLHPVGGFVPLVLHDPNRDPLPAVVRALDTLTAMRTDVLVLAAATGSPGYESSPTLDAPAWGLLCERLDAVAARAAERGVRASLHPHVGTVVEREDDIRQVLAGSGIPLCLDTGHLMMAGTDPLSLVREVPGRIAHVHLKDVDTRWAARVRRHEVTYADAVRAGMYRPLGRGEVDVDAIVGTLERAGYAGWYVLEQDRALTTERDADTVLGDVRSSLAHLRGVTT